MLYLEKLEIQAVIELACSTGPTVILSFYFYRLRFDLNIHQAYIFFWYIIQFLHSIFNIHWFFPLVRLRLLRSLTFNRRCTRVPESFAGRLNLCNLVRVERDICAGSWSLESEIPYLKCTDLQGEPTAHNGHATHHNIYVFFPFLSFPSAGLEEGRTQSNILLSVVTEFVTHVFLPFNQLHVTILLFYPARFRFTKNHCNIW